MRGRWAAGIVPRNFSWIIQDRLAVSERPGGQAPHHRPVRRQEEIIWITSQHFSRVISLLPSNHNLHAYEERSLPAAHFPLPYHSDAKEVLAALYPALLGWLRDGEKLLMHHEELGDRVAGVVAGFLCWSGVLPEPPRATSVVEQLLKRQMGSPGRALVAAAAELPPPPPGSSPITAPDVAVPAPDAPPSAETAETAALGEDPAVPVAAAKGAARRARPSRAKQPVPPASPPGADRA